MSLKARALTTATPTAGHDHFHSAHAPDRAASTVTKGDSPEAQIPLDDDDKVFENF